VCVGAIVHIKGQGVEPDRARLADVLVNLAHRGAVGAEHNTGDGAGILLQDPAQVHGAGDPGGRVSSFRHQVTMAWALATCPPMPQSARAARSSLPRSPGAKGLRSWMARGADGQLGPGRNGPGCEPRMLQVFVGRGEVGRAVLFERKLYVLRGGGRGEAEQRRGLCLLRQHVLTDHRLQGDAIGTQRRPITPTCRRMTLRRRSRWCTRGSAPNTFPSWERAHPYRYIIHQRRDQHAAREHQLDAGAAGDVRERAFRRGHRPCAAVIDRTARDSAMVDNCLSSCTWRAATWLTPP
jgi:glutamate synthase (ferredoxin)